MNSMSNSPPSNEADDRRIQTQQETTLYVFTYFASAFKPASGSRVSAVSDWLRLAP